MSTRKPWDPFASPFIRESWQRNILIREQPKKARIDGRELIGPCVIWRGWNNGKGEKDAHGIVRVNGQRWYIHRFAFAMYYKIDLTPSDAIDHLCRFRLCFNPLHLESVTPLENFKRGNGPLTTFRKYRDHLTDEDIEGLLP